MKTLYSFLLVGIATLLLVNAKYILGAFSFSFHAHDFINSQVQYQLFAFTIALISTGMMVLIHPESRSFLQIGELSNKPQPEKWLGMNGTSSWKSEGIKILVFISIPTTIFMSLAVYYTHKTDSFEWYFLPFIVVLSCFNALSEELLFRFVILGGLFKTHSKKIILLCSAIAFGIPHYWGWPSGFVGVCLASILGYVLCKATIETKGLFMAWFIHFVQDLIIFTALMMINSN